MDHRLRALEQVGARRAPANPHVVSSLRSIPLPPPPSPFLSEEQRAFADSVRSFALTRLDDETLPERDREGRFWHDGWRACAALNLCGLPAPGQYGGSDADHLTTAAALEGLGYGCRDGGLVFSISAHLWSAVVPIWQHGTAEQRAKYLPKLTTGEWIGVHAMTEPEAGSDSLALATTATPDGDAVVLNGTKTFITNAPIADVFIVFARSPGSVGPRGVTAYLVDGGAAGLTIGRSIDKLGLRTSPMAELVLQDVRVDQNAALGRVGRGTLVFSTSMAWERVLIMAGSLGAAYRALEDTIEYARTRRQFGRPIGSFYAVAEKLVDVRVTLDSARALLYEAAWRVDHDAGDAATAAATKLAVSESVVSAALQLVQVHGASGYTKEVPIERHLRDVLGSRIYSGTSDMMRTIVAGAMGF